MAAAPGQAPSSSRCALGLGMGEAVSEFLDRVLGLREVTR